MAPLMSAFLAASILAAHAVAQATNAALVGTWSTKSGKVTTGSTFYNPTTDAFIEPDLTGISYSFTADGFYEEAYFRAIPNPVTPSCPQALMQWQHGSYKQSASGAMKLVPISEDGRSLFSDPCNPQGKAILSKYSQNETFSKVTVAIDPYNQKTRLDLYAADGTPLNPMWQKSTTPVMLPTTTLGAEKATATSTSTAKMFKRAISRGLAGDTSEKTSVLAKRALTRPDTWFWLGLSMTGVGGVVVFLC